METVTMIGELHTQILHMQRRMRWLRVHTPARHDAITSNLLPVIANFRFYSRDLRGYLKMNAIQVSRLLKRIERLGLMTSIRTTTDARLKRMELSPRGRSALREIVTYDNMLVAEGLRALSPAKRGRLTEGLAVLSSGFGAPPEEALEGEDPFVTEQKRAARVLGMLGNDYLDSGLDIATYQLCFRLFFADLPVRFRELKTQLPFEASYISREIDRLVERRWFEKSGDQRDARAVFIAMTPRGRSEFGRLHAAATGRIEKALELMDKTELRALIELFAEANAGELSIPESPRIRVERCRSKRDLFGARALVIEWIVAKNQHHKLPATLVADDSVCYLIRSEGVAVAVAVLNRIAGTACHLDRLEVSPGYAFETQHLEALRAHLREADGISDLRIPAGTPGQARRRPPEKSAPP